MFDRAGSKLGFFRGQITANYFIWAALTLASSVLRLTEFLYTTWRFFRICIKQIKKLNPCNHSGIICIHSCILNSLCIFFCKMHNLSFPGYDSFCWYQSSSRTSQDTWTLFKSVPFLCFQQWWHKTQTSLSPEFFSQFYNHIAHLHYTCNKCQG